MSTKPIPVVTAISQPFWDGVKQGKLQVIHCNSCQAYTFYPRKHCQHCLSHDIQWTEVSGKGTLYSYTIARIPTLPEFADTDPQILAVVELEQGVRMNTTLMNVNEEDITIGMPVVAVLDKVTAQGDTLVQFAPLVTNDNDILQVREYNNPLTGLAHNEQGQVCIDVKNHTALNALVDGEFTPWSNKVCITQETINQFAALSGDDYWIHTDPEKAATDSPYQKTIAHGALVQILQSRLQIPFGHVITGYNTMVNYGSNKLRFPAPVPVDSEIHARAKVKQVESSHKGLQVVLEIHTHVVGEERPSVINELVIFYR